MTTQELSNAFDTMVNSYGVTASFGEQSSSRNLVFDEYEKSLFLTQAQEELTISLYTGKNSYGESFESTEEIREYLKPLIRNAHKDIALVDNMDAAKAIIRYGDCKVYRASLGENILGIIYEEVTFDDPSLGCKDGTTVPVIPVRHDEIAHILKNPFRGVSSRRVLRVDNQDNGNKMELLSEYSLEPKSYYIRYIIKPLPIILTDLGDSVTIEGSSNESLKINDDNNLWLPRQLHNRILEMAVRKAIQSRGYSLQTENKDN